MDACGPGASPVPVVGLEFCSGVSPSQLREPRNWEPCIGKPSCLPFARGLALGVKFWPCLGLRLVSWGIGVRVGVAVFKIIGLF